MPIRPQHRWLYPIDWPQLSAVIRFGRAKGKCEGCGRAHGLEVRRLPDGRWTRVVRATAHLDHDPANNRPSNLKALCQRCHILHDREEHGRRRWLTYRARKAVGDLFTGRYPGGTSPSFKSQRGSDRQVTQARRTSAVTDA